MQPKGPSTAGLMYTDTGGTGPVVVLLHGVLMNGSVWNDVGGGLSKKRVPNELFLSWIKPLRGNRKVRQDLEKYLRNRPPRRQLLEWAEQQRAFQGPVLVVWAREDKLMPAAHAERLVEHFGNARLVWMDACRTLVPIDQPEILTDHLRLFLRPNNA